MSQQSINDLINCIIWGDKAEDWAEKEELINEKIYSDIQADLRQDAEEMGQYE